ncbi:aminopeptidase P family protein [Acholeplasma hippikon]|uniref:Xaa-Pro aminopeptidase n=1 Tax=Acholeplasma hippikon TaxID=264636 RepID=A0A449BJN3_9MOLU|nr:aminopeptidase P family protein [Acholeplasma hippikon]VEU82537.1 Xaa-Pro aminopeptidase [Acholeplasma hippikon]
MLQDRRKNYLKEVVSPSLSFFYSGHAPHLSNDAYYHFKVNNNFYYLSGIDQEDAILLIAKAHGIEESYLFIQAVDPEMALWVGETLTFEKASEISGIKLENVRDIKTFDTFVGQLFSQTRRSIFGNVETVYFDVERQRATDEPLLGERKAKQFLDKYPFVTLKNARPILSNLRSVKDEVEIEAVKGAIEISRKANLHLLDKLKYAKNEFELEAEYNYVLNMNNTVPSFGSIIASGKNGTILHYEDNNQPLHHGDLVLFDLGVRYKYYASDISRTYPLNGKFTDRQKEVYQAVLNVNKEIIKWAKPGMTQFEYNQKGVELLTREAKRIGLIKEDKDIVKYYYHGLGHPLGLDVHDVADPRVPFKAGQIITVEPGLYIAEEGIGIRIEDDLLLTENGCINLSESILKEVDEIESYLAKK